MGRDHTIFALINGQVRFSMGRGGRQLVNVDPVNDAAKAAE